MAVTESSVSNDLYTEDHRIFRESFKKFVEQEITPYHEQWEKDGVVSRELWEKAGEQGFLAFDVPEEYGGLGLNDFRFNAIVGEELMRACATGPAFDVHSDICVPYIHRYGTEKQKQKYLPGCVSGDIITAIAMTEPNTGSDLGGVKTTAIDQGDHYLLNGQKTFITNGLLHDLVIVVAKTDPSERHKGTSLLLVERDMEGYDPPRKLDKIGMHAQDTAELFFNNVKVPKENILGGEGKGFYCLMQQLPQERMTIAVKALASAEYALEQTVTYCKERHAFGKPIGTFQNSRFKLAEMKTETTVGRAFITECLSELLREELTAEKAAMAKWWATDLQVRTVDQCLQLHGGYGYMAEYPIAKMYIDSRPQTIYGGTNEIMKEIIGRSMGF